MRRFILPVLGLLGILVTSAASAGPLLAIQVYEDNALIGSTSSGSGASTIGGFTPSGLFGYGAVATGVPMLPSPSLSAGTISVSSFFGFSGVHTLAVAFTQTGLSADGGGGGLLSRIASSFTANFLGLTQAVTSVTVSSWIDAGNGAFAKTTLLGAQTFTANGANASPTFLSDISLAPGSLFSETILISATFTGGGASVIASAQLVAVPEPASLVLFGTALLGLGLVMAGRRRAAPAG